MGATFSNRKIMLKPRTALIGFAASMLCLFAEVFLLKNNDIPIEYNMYIFLLPATFFLFSFATSIELKDCSIYKYLRSTGMVIYFSHHFVNELTSLAVSVVDAHFNIELIRYQFILSLSFTLLIALFLGWLAQKERFKWVNWVLS